MKIQHLPMLIGGLLALALAAGGCAATDTARQPPTPAAAPATAQPVASTQPAATATAAPAAPAATAAPTITAIPAASATPLPAPTQAPATTVPAVATAEPIVILLADKPWVRSGDIILALGDGQRQLALRSPIFPSFRYGAVATPDGSKIAYIDDQDRLAVVETSGTSRHLPEDHGMNAVGYSFSPDSRELAFTTSDGQRWQLQVADLASGATRTLQEGAHIAQGDALPLTLRPIGWTADGILAEQILWASDAPPQGLVLVSASDGSTRPLRKQGHIQAALAPDGHQIAIVVGETPIGPDATPSREIRIFDAGDAGERVIVPLRPGFVRELHWSPDSAKLLYAESESYTSPVAAVVATDRDGSNEQRTTLPVDGPGMTLRDLAWLDSATALVLLGDPGARLELHALPLASFDAASLKLLGTFAGQIDLEHQILYVPHGV